MDMPDFRDEDGTRWIWDADSKTYVKAHGDPFSPDRSHATGGDNELFDPARHTFKPKNPDATGILAAAFDQCKNCGGKLNEDAQCSHCNGMENDFNSTPNQEYPAGPFYDAQPKRNPTNYDDSFPSRLTNYKSDLDPAVRIENSGGSVKHAHVLAEEDWKQANSPTLDACPECDGPMVDKKGEKVCHSCGHTQPVIHIEATEKSASVQKTSWAFLAPLMGMAARAGAGAAGAAAGEGAAAGGAATAGGAAESGLAGSLMRGAMKPGSMQGINELIGGSGGENTSVAEPIVEPGLGNASTLAATHEAADDIFSDEKNEGRDDHPEFGATEGFRELVGDGPENLKDVDGGRADAAGGLADDAMNTFKHALPLVVYYAESEDSGSENPVMQALDQIMESAFPGYKGAEEEAAEESAPESDDEPKEEEKPTEKAANVPVPVPGNVAPQQQMYDAMQQPCPTCGATGPCLHKQQPENMSPQTNGVPGAAIVASVEERLEIVAARKPKMCPFHNDLVDYSLMLGEPQAALGAVTPASYGEAYCKSGGFEGKCNFKPAMVQQTYWDEKDAQAEQRRMEREQAAQNEWVSEFEAPALVETEAPSEDGGSNHHPSFDDAPSAVGAPAEMQVAAAQKIGREWTDDSGHPLKEGSSYLLKNPTYAIPDRITISHITPERLTFKISTDVMEYEDSLTAQDAENQQYEFLPTEEKADAPFEADHPVTHEGGFKENEDGSMQTVRTAGKDFTHVEQRQFINEAGAARNLDRLDLAGTHYPEAEDKTALVETHSLLW